MKLTTRFITLSALIAAAYVVLTTLLAPISFGVLQVRVAECMSVLCVFGPIPLCGLTAGCAISNAIGVATGQNLAGVLDILIGTSATLIAGILSYLLRNITLKGLPLLSVLPPILINAVVIGIELTVVLYPGEFSPWLFALNMLTIAGEQTIACAGLGIPFYLLVKKARLDRYFSYQRL
ncbi:MAG: QueT transporter family protein [Oscillospiraceae bacterium]|nr:QueT transporter family protein [Oscillospiraceae bacterium]